MLRMTTRNTTKIVETLWENEKRRGWANNENNLKLILEKRLTDEIHTYIKLRKGFENSSGKLEESGKILGKDLWVRAHSIETLLKWFYREIAPVQLNGLNKVRPRNSLNGSWMKRQAFWDIFSTPEQLNSEKWMTKRCTGMRKHLKWGKNMINTESLSWIH